LIKLLDKSTPGNKKCIIIQSQEAQLIEEVTEKTNSLDKNQERRKDQKNDLTRDK